MTKARKRGDKEAKKIKEAEPAPTSALAIGAAPSGAPKSKKS